MTIRKAHNKRTSRKLEAACEEHERVIESLRQQVRAVEQDRDEIRQGFEELTRALRHRGCCDSIDQPHSHT
jgi:septal ring factor EnvC (AmiA/AmiB activator)